MKTAVIMGVGPERGVGGQLCLRFAAEGLHVIAAGRTQASLDAIVETITAQGGSAEACVADATIEGDVIRLFDKAGDNLDVAVYNAGNNTPGRISEMEASYFETAWRVVCFGGFLFGRETVGLPRELVERYGAAQIPMRDGPIRSLNLSNAVAVVEIRITVSALGSIRLPSSAIFGRPTTGERKATWRSTQPVKMAIMIQESSSRRSSTHWKVTSPR